MLKQILNFLFPQLNKSLTSGNGGKAELIGTIGERYTQNALNIARLFGRRGKVLSNVYIPKEDGTTTEIDLLFITQKGIFVIESKNFSGWIFGKENDNYWTATLPTQKNKFYNPIKQNKTHIKWLKAYLEDDVPMFSIIVFSDRCEFKKMVVDISDVRVIHRERLYYNINEIWCKYPDVMSNQQINTIFEKLKILTNVDDAVKQNHISSIKRKYDKPASVSDESVMTFPVAEESVQEHKDELVCPRCGNALVLRQAKKGERVGKSFYGCSAFPKCRYIKNIE